MKKFEIKNRYGLKIVGEILEPENSKGLAFVLHGLGGYKEQTHIKLITDTFYSNDLTIINFDATNSVGESEGKYEDATLGKHYEDLVDVISWSKTQDFYQEPFILSGHSMGAQAILEYAENYPLEIKGVFAFAPVVSGELSFEAYQNSDPNAFENWKKTGWQERKSSSKPGLIKRLPWSHMEERLNHDLLQDSDKLNMPLAILVGSEDIPCPVKNQKILFDKLNCEKDLYIVKDAPHSFKTEEHLNELKKYLNIWLNKFN